VSAAGIPVELARHDADLDASASIGPQSSAWDLVVASPADGPFLRLERLGVGEDDAIAWWIGEAATRVPLLTHRPKFGEPPRVSAAPPVGEGKGLRFAAPAYAAWADDATLADQSSPACSPLRVEVADRRLTKRVSSSAPVLAGLERSAHLGEFFWAPARFAEGEVARAGRLVLDPLRICGASFWLYPGDSLDGRARLTALRGLRHGAGAFVVRAHDVRRTEDPASTGGLSIELAVGKRDALNEIVPFVAMGGELRFALEPPLVGTPSVRWKLENPGPDAVIVDGLEFAE
jgi:hypothetical protein